MKCLTVLPDVRPPTKTGALLSTSAKTAHWSVMLCRRLHVFAVSPKCCSTPRCHSNHKQSAHELADGKGLRSTPTVSWGWSSMTLPASGYPVPRRRGFPCSTAPTRHAQAHRGVDKGRHHHKSYCVEHGSRPALWRSTVGAIQGSAVLSESKTPSPDRRLQLASVNKVLGLRCWTGIRPPHSAEGHDGYGVRHTPGLLAVRIRPESTNCNQCPSQKDTQPVRQLATIHR